MVVKLMTLVSSKPAKERVRQDGLVLCSYVNMYSWSPTHSYSHRLCCIPLVRSKSQVLLTLRTEECKYIRRQDHVWPTSLIIDLSGPAKHAIVLTLNSFFIYFEKVVIIYGVSVAFVKWTESLLELGIVVLGVQHGAAFCSCSVLSWIWDCYTL